MKATATAASQSNTPTINNFDKGELFEDYVISLFKVRKHIRLLEWRNKRKASNGMFVESNLLPDLEFAFGYTRKKFAIECKWRQKFSSAGLIKWASENQIKNYQQYQKERNIPVFIAIGIGGQPSDPENLFITPLNNICMHTEVYSSNLLHYKREPKKELYFDVKQLMLFQFD